MPAPKLSQLMELQAWVANPLPCVIVSVDTGLCLDRYFALNEGRRMSDTNLTYGLTAQTLVNPGRVEYPFALSI